jgi:hypothetical protein
VLLALALSSKEGTQDYEWQLKCFRDATGVDPQLTLIDADPGVCAAVAIKYPASRHLWCMWHLHQNLRNNLGAILGNQYFNFNADFKHCQAHMTEKILWQEYSPLKERWPEAAPYLDKHLTPKVRYWASFKHTRFSTSAVSTQRGEGLNRHLKAHLSGKISLNALFTQVIQREEREEVKAIVDTAKDEVYIHPLKHSLNVLCAAPWPPSFYLPNKYSLQYCRMNGQM